ncbi:MAG TPA: S8 family serine peptidase, partial [Actinotalea sp.]|nr:S8 family serine peptidase [Actinotalea sp.]
RIDRGKKYDVAAIAAMLAAPESAQPTWDADGHGTHVAGTAAGNGAQGSGCHGAGHHTGVAPAADLVVVKTPFTSTDNMAGVRWAFAEAGARPCVAALSRGSESTAHDGSDDEEVEYDAILAATPTGRSIVTTAGNVGALADVTDPYSPPQGGMHCRKTIAANGTVTMSVVVAANDKKEDWLSIWYGDATRLSLVITEPGGAATATIPVGGASYTTPLAGHPMFVWSRTDASSTGRHRIAIRIEPRTTDPTTIAAGTWVLRLTETAGTGGDVDCWISRDVTDKNPRFVVADQDRTRTVGSPGSGHSVVTVANYDHRDNTMAASSS